MNGFDKELYIATVATATIIIVQLRLSTFNKVYDDDDDRSLQGLSPLPILAGRPDFQPVCPAPAVLTEGYRRPPKATVG